METPGSIIPYFLGIFPKGGGSCLGCTTMGAADPNPAIAHAAWIVPGDVYIVGLCGECIPVVRRRAELARVAMR